MYQVLARKWRPQIFQDLVGQQTVTKTLQNAITSGRIAHAFLFSGPRGIGKTTSARILAKALNCNSSSGPVETPCNQCASCIDISNSRSMDVLEIDGASNRGIDEVRELRESAKYQPIRDRFRIFIIDEVHMLTTEAFNALLKILEEPPPHVFFIFATTELRKVPATIVSRCQLFEFKRIPDSQLVQRLSQIVKEEKIKISSKSLEMIATASEGGLRDALGILDQMIAFGGNKIDDKDVQAVLGLVDIEVMIQLGEAIANGDSAEVLKLLGQIAEYGIDYKIFYNELLAFYRDLFMLRYSEQDLTGTDERLRRLASQYDEVQLLRICHQLVSIQNLLKQSGNLRFLFEITLVKLSQIKRLVPIEEVVESLKKNVSTAFSVVPASSKTIPQAPSARITRPETESNRTAAREVPDDFFALFINDLEASNAKLAAALGNAKVIQAGNTVTFYIPETYYAMIKQNPKDKADLQTLLRQRIGEDVNVEIVKGDPPVEKQAVKVSTPETLVANDPVVQEFMKTFDGKISKIELKKSFRI
jgi:DNA polymerase-3 subunit gamma/tau